MRKTTFSILYYGKKNGLKVNGKMPIMGRITVNGKSIQFSTKVEIDPRHWNATAGKSHPNYPLFSHLK